MEQLEILFNIDKKFYCSVDYGTYLKFYSTEMKGKRFTHKTNISTKELINHLKYYIQLNKIKNG